MGHLLSWGGAPARCSLSNRTHLFLLLAKAEAGGPLLHHYTGDASGARPSCAAHDYIDVSFAAATDEGLRGRSGKTAGASVMGQWEVRGSGTRSQDGPNWAQTGEKWWQRAQGNRPRLTCKHAGQAGRAARGRAATLPGGLRPAAYLGAIEDVMVVLSHSRGHEGGSIAPTP